MTRLNKCGAAIAAAFSAFLLVPSAFSQTKEICGINLANVSKHLQELANARPDTVQRTPIYLGVTDTTDRKTWTATLPGHPAHPVVVCRHPISTDKGIEIKTEVICQGPKYACDNVVAEFQALNDQIRKQLEQKSK